jgi:hypothetical protein
LSENDTQAVHDVLTGTAIQHHTACRPANAALETHILTFPCRAAASPFNLPEEVITGVSEQLLHHVQQVRQQYALEAEVLKAEVQQLEASRDRHAAAAKQVAADLEAVHAALGAAKQELRFTAAKLEKEQEAFAALQR